MDESMHAVTVRIEHGSGRKVSDASTRIDFRSPHEEREINDGDRFDAANPLRRLPRALQEMWVGEWLPQQH